MTSTITEAQALAAGGKLWEKGGKRRVYLNDVTGLLGLDVVRYNSGNVCGATLNGAEISNTKATKLLAQVQRVWVEDGQVYAQGTNTEQSTIARLAAVLAAVEA